MNKIDEKCSSDGKEKSKILKTKLYQLLITKLISRIKSEHFVLKKVLV